MRPSEPHRLQLAKTVAQVFNFTCFGVAVALYFFPKPYILSWTAALAPVVGAVLVKVFNGLIIWWGRDKARPTVGVAVAPAVGLSMSHAKPASDRGFAVGLDGIGRRIDRRRAALYPRLTSARKWSQIVVFAGLAGFCTYGMAAVMTLALDTSAPKVLR